MCVSVCVCANVSSESPCPVHAYTHTHVYVYIYIYIYIYEIDTGIRVQISEGPFCISHIAITLGKGMNPVTLTPAIGKY